MFLYVALDEGGALRQITPWSREICQMRSGQEDKMASSAV